MRRSLVLCGSVAFVVGVAFGLYASQRNCLIAFITRGYMSFWTAVEILAGLMALVGIVIALIGFIRSIASCLEEFNSFLRAMADMEQRLRTEGFFQRIPPTLSGSPSSAPPSGSQGS